MDESMKETSPALRLKDHYNNPTVIEKNNNLDDILRGMTLQAEEDSDETFNSVG